MPLISVIIPVYKVENYIDRCIISVINQTFQDFEIILVDDGSPDNCPQICDKYAKKYSNIFVIHKDNGGSSSARNCGIEHSLHFSDSKYLTFIDSDDWVHPQYLELLYKTALAHDVEVTACGFFRTGNLSMKNTSTDSVEVYIGKAENLWCEKKLNLAVAWGKLYKKCLFNEIRYPQGAYFEDMRTTPKIILHQEKIAVLGCQLYYYYYRKDSIMQSTVSGKKLEDSFNCFKEMIIYFRDNQFYDAMRNWFQVYFKWQYFKIKTISWDYFRYVFKHKIFLLSLWSCFSFIEYEEEYSKVYSKFYIRIMQKLETMSCIRNFMKYKGMRK